MQLMILERSAEYKKTKFSLRFGKIAFILGLMLMLSAGVYAQDDATDATDATDAEPNTVNGDPDAPFDGGISLLVAAGVAYGAKQWHSSRKQSREEDVAVSE